MDGVSLRIDDEEFEDMDITDADKQEIVELSSRDDLYEAMVASVAPSIYGYDQQKLAMILQLFSGVTKHLPDGSRIRGDLHMLLIGDPGTGKCVAGDTRVTLADGREVPIRELVESNLDDPKPVDDGVWDEVDFEVPSLRSDGTFAPQRATKVWKRETPDQLYRIRTEIGHEIDVTPSHPLFVQSGESHRAVRAEELDVGREIAVGESTSNSLLADGGAVSATGCSETTDSSRCLSWQKIAEIEPVEPDEEWVYDLEVTGTHNYISNNVVSHNSQLLSYVRNIAPRSVYTSGKGTSSAGLCVTGDTLIHTDDGFREIADLVTEKLPSPVETETAAEREIAVQTFDRSAGEMDTADSSHVWRMPEKSCRRIETNHGKELEASQNTPVLACGADGIEWRPISAVEAGDHVAVPRYDDIDREPVAVREFLELTGEKLRLSDDSVELLRDELCEEFGTLRDAASELDLTEPFVYDSLPNRHVPLDKLGRILTAVGLSLDEIEIERAMLRHGDSITIPEEFDADLMYLLGLVFGDGDISLDRRDGNRGMVRISNSDEGLLRRAADIFAEQFDKRPEIERQEDRVPCIRVSSATIARLFHNAGMESPKADLALDPRLTTAKHADAFLRGLMDADGSVSSRTDGGSSLLFSTISEELVRQVQLMLETYGVRARTRERDRRGEYELADGYVIESKHVQQFLELYGADIDRYAEQIGFELPEKRDALAEITGQSRKRKEKIPVGEAVSSTATAGGEYYNNVTRNYDPGRERARSMLADLDLGDSTELVREAVEADLRWDEVVAAVDTGEKEVFDLTVPETHNFVGNGLVTHNTAAAVQDDFGDGQQWTLEAGALVLADKGIAAVDELDKMNPDDRSAMHEGLEQQEISISKAGINATLKSRCSLLGAANPKYGRFDQYEPIGEQIDLEPALVSRFDLIFTVTDQPDPEKDADLADHIINTNYAGELHTQRTNTTNSNFTQEEVDDVTEDVAPEIEPELLRKYIAYAKRTCYPTMTDEAKQAIRDFYVDLRAKGADEDAPVPVTARKLEAIVRLSEASARVRISDTVEIEDAERVIEIVRSCLQDIGVDPETGQFDADVVETGRSKTQRDRVKNIRQLINDIESEYEQGAPVDEVLERAEDVGMDRSKAEHEIEKLRRQGEVYEPSSGHLRTT
jgi:replicative DNA helicase Mcm